MQINARMYYCIRCFTIANFFSLSRRCFSKRTIQPRLVSREVPHVPALKAFETLGR